MIPSVTKAFLFFRASSHMGFFKQAVLGLQNFTLQSLLKERGFRGARHLTQCRCRVLVWRWPQRRPLGRRAWAVSGPKTEIEPQGH